MDICLEKPIIKIFNTDELADVELYSKLYNAVSDERRSKVDAYRFEKDKRLSLAAGYLLESGLEELGIGDRTLVYGSQGKPYLKNGEVHFSLSHSGTYAVCAWYAGEVGADVERVAQAKEQLIRRICRDSEYGHIMGLDEAERNEEFFRLWTAKESYMKYLGLGLSLAPDELEVSFGDSLGMSRDGKYLPVRFVEYPLTGYKLTICC